ncbi:MAG: hypothetical protein R2843_00590 [Thermomicrobiales bacterium]
MLRQLLPLLVLLSMLAAPLIDLKIPVVFKGAINSPGTLQLLAVGLAYGIAALSYIRFSDTPVSFRSDTHCSSGLVSICRRLRCGNGNGRCSGRSLLRLAAVSCWRW